MVLRFPNVDVLRLALMSGAIPASVASTPVGVGVDFSGCIWVRPGSPITRESATKLKQLGVERKRKPKVELHELDCWPQALPLIPNNSGGDMHQEVLFELRNENALAEIVTEIMRLGNDRQSFATIENVDGSGVRCLLRVIDPPHYTMLRAIDATDGPVAYTHVKPGVWVQSGFRHPLTQSLDPPNGQWLLIRPDADWRWIEEPVMTDIYQSINFVIGSVPISLRSDATPNRFEVSVRFRESTSHEPAELWVVSERSMTQMEAFLDRSDDSLLDRLAFAVASENSAEDAEPIVVLRARSAQDHPPVLVLDALECRPYQRIPNLFVPCGQRLQPPLRRDAVIDLFAKDNDRIHWLRPETDQSFVPYSLPDSAFRPLRDWVDYVIDHNAKPLRAWIDSQQFDFDAFLCSDVVAPPLPEPPRTADDPTPATGAKTPKKSSPRKTQQKKNRRTHTKPDRAARAPTEVKPPAGELQNKLRELEKAYRESHAPLDSPQRCSLWIEMGDINSQLGDAHDTSICYSNAIWNHEDLREGQNAVLAEHAQHWLRSELQCYALKSGGSDSGAGSSIEIDALRDDSVVDQPRHLDSQNLELLIQNLISDSTTSSQPGLVAAHLVTAGQDAARNKWIKQHAVALIDYLRKNENHLPLRAAWLSWCSIYRAAGNDVLLLARARDRLLERLFHRGLAPELDLASFLRLDSAAESDRYRFLKDHFVAFHQHVQPWVREPEITRHDPQTHCYADLVFSYGFARLGDSSACQQLRESAAQTLEGDDPVHRWILDAFSQRIQEALNGRPLVGGLASDLMAVLEDFTPGQKYVIDRLRQRSRILEPHRNVNPFENFLHRYSDDLGRALAELPKIIDAELLAERLDTLFDSYRDPRELVRILPDALQVVPRLGEQYASGLIDRVWAVLDSCDHAFDKAVLINRGLLIAAHYGRIDLVQSLVHSMDSALPDLVDQYLALTPTDRAQADAMEALLTQSFRGMRRLGMREEIGAIYGRVESILDDRVGGNNSDQSDRLRLRLASGWYYFGITARADEITSKVLTRLQGEPKLDPPTTRLLTAYLEAIACAPIERAMTLVESVFTVEKSTPKITNQATSMTTDSHFSIAHLDTVETAVMSLISDDFALSPESRRRLDEDEYLVRTRIHRDMRSATGGA